MENLDKEIALYEREKSKLENDHLGEWVLIHNAKIISVYKTFELAAQDAVKRFGSGPYLIRQIGATQIILPASVVYNI